MFVIFFFDLSINIKHYQNFNPKKIKGGGVWGSWHIFGNFIMLLKEIQILQEGSGPPSHPPPRSAHVRRFHQHSQFPISNLFKSDENLDLRIRLGLLKIPPFYHS